MAPILSRQKTGDFLPDILRMRTFPVDSLAIDASMENLIVEPGLGLETIQNIRLGDRCQHTVANQASRKKMNRAVQVEAAQDLIDLVFDVDPAHPVAVIDLFDTQEAAVAGQQDALLVHRDTHHIRIPIVVAIETVETQQTHALGELAQMHVQDESGIRQGFFAQAEQRGDVQAFENRVDSDAVASLQLIIESHRLTIDDDQIYLGVGHTENFDGVLDSGMTAETVIQRPPALLTWKKIIQFRVETKLSCVFRFHVIHLPMTINSLSKIT